MDEEEFRYAYDHGDILNPRAYFDEDLNYIEEFDTYNGSHHLLIVAYEDWTDEIRQFADEILQD